MASVLALAGLTAMLAANATRSNNLAIGSGLKSLRELHIGLPWFRGEVTVSFALADIADASITLRTRALYLGPTWVFLLFCGADGGANNCGASHQALSSPPAASS